jgi:cytochrome bd-type quinol oxidase subunit 2
MTQIAWVTDFATVFIEVGIVVFSLLAAYYNFKWLKKFGKKHQRWLRFVKTVSLVTSAVWAVIYIYALAKVIAGAPIDTNWFGVFAVRPAILLTSFSFAISAKARYVAATLGGSECLTL